MSFSKYVIWLATRTDLPGRDDGVPNFSYGPVAEGCSPGLVDWNLDSDRGYGYHCWDWNRRSDGSQHQDPNRHAFNDPCEWPPQASDAVPDATKPLPVHWATRPDPGCDVDADCVKPRS